MDLIVNHMGLAKRIARSFRWALAPHIGFEDLVSEAYVGLIKAHDRFDPDRGVKFQTYAKPWIHGAISNFVESQGGAVRIPRRVYRLAGQVIREGIETSTPKIVAEALKCSTGQASAALQAISQTRSTSLDQPVAGDEMPSLGEKIGHEQDTSSVAVREFMKSLRPSEHHYVRAAVEGKRPDRPVLLRKVQSKLAAYMELSESEVVQMSHELTKEKYLDRKAKAVSDDFIAKEFGLANSTLFRKKQAWGVLATKTTSPRQAPTTPPATPNNEDHPPRDKRDDGTDAANRRIATLEQEVKHLKALLKIYL